MGIFSAIKDTYKKSQAAVVVQNLLEHQAKVGFFEGDPAKTANVLIQSTWDHNADIFGGKFGQRPHKISAAAYALGTAIAGMPEDHAFRVPFALSLGTILAEVERNGSFYPLNSLDGKLLEMATSAYLAAAGEMDPDWTAV